MYPPASGPAMDATPQTPLKNACVRARSASEYSSPTMVMLRGTTAPAPRPCMARAAISMVIDVAAPDSAEPTRKTAIPPRYMRRRPYRSESRPQIGTEAVDVRRYAENTQL